MKQWSGRIISHLEVALEPHNVLALHPVLSNKQALTQNYDS